MYSTDPHMKTLEMKLQLLIVHRQFVQQLLNSLPELRNELSLLKLLELLCDGLVNLLFSSNSV